MGKILFIRGGAVGDFILTMPAINLVRENLPENEIQILGYESIASLAVAAGLADRVRSIEHAALAPFFAPGAKLNKEICTYFQSFDVVISYLYDPDNIFADNLLEAGVETLIRGPFRMDEQDQSPVHAAQQLAVPIGQLALFLDRNYIEVRYPDTCNRQLPTKPIVAIHPGSGSPAKNWSFENWVQLANLIAAQVDVHFLIISGEAEAERIDTFTQMMQRADLDFQSITEHSLVEVANLIQQADLFLGHDSGIAHLAATTGIAGHLLFGPTNPTVWAPAHPDMSISQAPEGQLGNLTVEMVKADLETKLEAVARKRSIEPL